MSEQISDIAYELQRLSTLTGKSFVRQLELITQYKGFIPIEGESNRQAVEVLLFKGALLQFC